MSWHFSPCIKEIVTAIKWRTPLSQRPKRLLLFRLQRYAVFFTEKKKFPYKCQYLILNDQFSNKIPDDILGIRSFSFSLIRRSYNHENTTSSITTANQDSYLEIDIPFHIAKLHKTFLSSLNNDFYLLATIIFISYAIIITIICILYKNKQIQSLTNKLQYIFMKYEESLKEKENL